MSSHQYHQYYNADANSNVQDEYDALLNSLVGSNQQGSVPYNSNQEHYNVIFLLVISSKQLINLVT